MIALGQVRRYHRALWGALLALCIAVLLSLHLTTAVSADVSVNIVNFKFDPTPLVVPMGTTVVWTNQDTAPHTATSDPGSAFTFDTGMLQKGQSGKITFTQVGTFTYYCKVHPNMHGTVTVTAAGAAPPSTGASPATTGSSSPSAATTGTGSGSGTSSNTNSGSGSSSSTTTAPSPAAPAPPPATASGTPTTSRFPTGFLRRLGDG